MTTKPAYTSDPDLSEPADVLLEHALVALTVEEKFAIARRLAHNLGYEIRRGGHAQAGQAR